MLLPWIVCRLLLVLFPPKLGISLCQFGLYKFLVWCPLEAHSILKNKKVSLNLNKGTQSASQRFAKTTLLLKSLAWDAKYVVRSVWVDTYSTEYHLAVHFVNSTISPLYGRLLLCAIVFKREFLNSFSVVFQPVSEWVDTDFFICLPIIPSHEVTSLREEKYIFLHFYFPFCSELFVLRSYRETGTKRQETEIIKRRFLSASWNYKNTGIEEAGGGWVEQKVTKAKKKNPTER